MAKIITEKVEMSKSDLTYWAGVLVGESYAGLRHILRFEDNADVVRFLVSRAPLGWEDKTGFHRGKKL